LATALDLIGDDAGSDDKEDTAQSAAEGNQDNNAIGVVGC
jgi:hypothetical protein